MSKILVTGGAGFIGSNLVDQLIQGKYEVVVVDNLSTGKKRNVNSQAKFYEMDIGSKELDKVFREEKFDYVFHLAAQIDARKSVDDPEFDIETNVIKGLNVIKNCVQHSIKKVIFTSTGGVMYGEAQIIPTPESVPAEPVCPYGINKLTFEKYLYYYYKTKNLPYSALRLSNVYGPRQCNGGESGVISIFIDNTVNKRKSIIFGTGEVTRDYIYMDDAVNSLIKAMSTDFTGVLNIGSGKETSVLEVVDLVESALGQKMDIENSPARPEQMRSCLDSNRAKKILDWQATTNFKEGMRKTIEWSRRVANMNK